MRYNLLVLLLVYRTTHSIIYIINKTNKNSNNSQIPPKILVAPPQMPSCQKSNNLFITTNSKNDTGTTISINPSIKPPTIPPVFMFIQQVI